MAFPLRFFLLQKPSLLFNCKNALMSLAKGTRGPTTSCLDCPFVSLLSPDAHLRMSDQFACIGRVPVGQPQLPIIIPSRMCFAERPACSSAIVTGIFLPTRRPITADHDQPVAFLSVTEAQPVFFVSQQAVQSFGQPELPNGLPPRESSSSSRCLPAFCMPSLPASLPRLKVLSVDQPQSPMIIPLRMFSAE